jgi:hypothetical protein
LEPWPTLQAAPRAAASPAPRRTPPRSRDVGRSPMPSRAGGRSHSPALPPAGRVRSHCRFRKRGTDYLSKSGITWMSGVTTRQSDRTLTAGLGGLSAASAATGLLYLGCIPFIVVGTVVVRTLPLPHISLNTPWCSGS